MNALRWIVYLPCQRAPKRLGKLVAGPLLQKLVLGPFERPIPSTSYARATKDSEGFSDGEEFMSVDGDSNEVDGEQARLRGGRHVSNPLGSIPLGSKTCVRPIILPLEHSSRVRRCIPGTGTDTYVHLQHV